MKDGDFTPVYDNSGKMTGRRVVSHYGNEYIIGKKLGAGGVAKVFHAQKVGDKKEYVFKEFIPKPETYKLHATIKKNVITLIQNPILDSSGNKLPHFVPPLDIVVLKSGGFGYIMDKVDTSTYKSVEKILNHHDYYPDAKMLCKFCKDFANFFQTIHLRGWCYKDINEGNIYINPDNGDFWVIDCDNISVEKDQTILGTAGYMAPEVYETEKPDKFSDYFSVAAFYFRLFVGSYPMDGPDTEQYMIQNDLSVDGAAPTIYGTRALFAFHPTDKRNAVYAATSNKDYQIQTRKWNALPVQIKKCMIKTFVTALPFSKCQQRTKDHEWIHCFEELENNHLVRCKKCKKYNFDNRKTCYRCGKDLPKVPNQSKKKNVPQPPVTPPLPKQPTTPKPPKHKYEVVFEYLWIVGGKQQGGRLAIGLDERIPGKRLHPDFSNAPMLYAHYREKEKKYTIHNLGPLTWELARNGRTADQPVGTEVEINTDLVIKVDKTKCLLKVLGIREKV